MKSWCYYDEDYLKRLREEYKLDELVNNCESEIDKVKAICKWVTSLWQHDGYNVPEQSDVLYILEQVTKNGQRYRCVEYGLVIEGCLSALGFIARVISLKSEDVETRESGAGHVATEVYLKEYDKWVFVDGQFGVIPICNNIPLNAFEFGDKLRKMEDGLDLIWVNDSEFSNEKYYEWIKRYLFYLDVSYLDENRDVYKIMYVPEGGKEVEIFQIKYPIKMNEYTRDINKFYE